MFFRPCFSLSYIILEGYLKALTADASGDPDPTDQASLEFYYPSYEKVRWKYNERRQAKHEGKKIKNQYDLPVELMVTKKGAVKLLLGKELAPEDK